MDVEKLRKINELAKELQKHGIAETSNEATKIAEKMVSTKKPTEDLPVSQVSEESGKESETELELRRLKSQVSQLFEIINQMQDKMNEIITEINKIADNGNKISNNTEGKKIEDEAQKKLLNESEPTQTSSNEKSSNPDNNPRSGNYLPGDVAIDKMFYFGKK